MKRKPFAWFDLARLMGDTIYPIQLASELQYSDPVKLALVLNDCREILLVRREGIKDYANKRKRHFDNAVLNDLPKYASKIKKLCQFNMVEWWVKPPSFRLNFVEFQFEIDQLDLLALLTINYIDEAITQAGNNAANETDNGYGLIKALEYWDLLQVRKEDWIDSNGTGETLFRLYKSASKHKQEAAGRKSGADNKQISISDDLRIAFVLLYLLNDVTNKNKSWRSLNEFTDSVLKATNRGLAQIPLNYKQSELGNVSVIRLKAVIKEINHVNQNLLRSFVSKPIPTIKAENSRWRDYKIIEKWDTEFNLTYLDFETQ